MIALTFLRKGGKLMRKNGKLVRYTTAEAARNLCDCCECTCETNQCCCHEIPDTLYCRVEKWVWKADCSGSEIKTYEFEMAKAAACDTQNEDDCPGYQWDVNCVKSRWCGYFDQPGCFLGIPAGNWRSLIALECARRNSTTQGFGLWYRQQADDDGNWGGCSYATFVGSAACPITILGPVEMSTLGLLNVTIQTMPF
jgi:hypothetical protein